MHNECRQDNNEEAPDRGLDAVALAVLSDVHPDQGNLEQGLATKTKACASAMESVPSFPRHSQLAQKIPLRRVYCSHWLSTVAQSPHTRDMLDALGCVMYRSGSQCFVNVSILEA